jgi:DNA (cytosine-5)-methyltransferase 1
LKFIDLFAGIGGFRLAFDGAGILDCVFSSEINPYARKTYRANFGDEPAGDIREIAEDQIPDHDILCGGFPCQPFSIAGVSKKNSLGRPHGFADKTQGTLFFEIVRILYRKRPQAILLENVKNLYTHDAGKTFATIRESLRDLGYTLFTPIIDAVHFVPQHRKRIYLIGFQRSTAMQSFLLEFERRFQYLRNEHPLRDIVMDEVAERYTLSDTLWIYLQKHSEKHAAAGNGFGFKSFADLNGATRTLTARYGRDGAEILLHQIPSARNPHGNPRRLTPRECARLMGFPDNFQIPVSDSQAYKQFGNAVVVPVVRKIAKAIRYALEMSAVPSVNC